MQTSVHGVGWTPDLGAMQAFLPVESQSPVAAFFWVPSRKHTAQGFTFGNFPNLCSWDLEYELHALKLSHLMRKVNIGCGLTAPVWGCTSISSGGWTLTCRKFRLTHAVLCMQPYVNIGNVIFYGSSCSAHSSLHWIFHGTPRNDLCNIAACLTCEVSLRCNDYSCRTSEWLSWPNQTSFWTALFLSIPNGNEE